MELAIERLESHHYEFSIDRADAAQTRIALEATPAEGCPLYCK